MLQVKLNELYAARAVMTSGKYIYSPIGCIDAPDCGELCVEVATLGGRNRPEDGRGLVLTHNAANVLIDIAFSGLALIRVLDLQNDLENRRRGPRSAEQRQTALDVARASAAHRTALAKVIL